MTKSVIITAGGVGKRMGYDIPKQFIELNGLPILMHTINCFYNYNKNLKIIVVLPSNQLSVWQELIIKHNFKVDHDVIAGGDERFFSIKNGLNAVDSDIVAIHDGVRPFVAKAVLDSCFENAEKNHNVVPVIDLKESIRLVKESYSEALERSFYKIVQTPQVFPTALIKKAYNQTYSSNFTDDASVLENMGEKIHTVKGNEENIKITTPLDLILAKEIIKAFK